MFTGHTFTLKQWTRTSQNFDMACDGTSNLAWTANGKDTGHPWTPLAQLNHPNQCAVISWSISFLTTNRVSALP